VKSELNKQNKSLVQSPAPPLNSKLSYQVWFAVQAKGAFYPNWNLKVQFGFGDLGKPDSWFRLGFAKKWPKTELNQTLAPLLGVERGVLSGPHPYHSNHSYSDNSLCFH
jgi:hypothetical protein